MSDESRLCGLWEYIVGRVRCMSNRSLVKVLMLLVAIVPYGGCAENGPANAVTAANDTNVKRLSNLYQSFASLNGWHGPKDEAEFRKFIQEFPAHRLQLLGVDPARLDVLFVSERDGQPFRIKYGASSGLGAVIAIVSEEQGVDGARAVGFTNGSVQSVDEAKYRQLFEVAP